MSEQTGKKILLHDLTPQQEASLVSTLGSDWVIIQANQKAARCVGCFRCWLKTPGVCTFADELEHVGATILSCQQLVIVSQMLYGGVSVPIKRVIDRCIPGITPFFKKRQGRLHHLQRYQSQMAIHAIFYQTHNNCKQEIDHSLQYIQAMGLNFHCKSTKVSLIEDMDFSGVSL